MHKHMIVWLGTSELPTGERFWDLSYKVTEALTLVVSIQHQVTDEGAIDDYWVKCYMDGKAYQIVEGKEEEVMQDGQTFTPEQAKHVFGHDIVALTEQVIARWEALNLIVAFTPTVN